MILFTLGVFSALCAPGVRGCRVLAFAGLFFYVAFRNSFGKIGHSDHAWVYVSFLFIFLPDGKRGAVASSRAGRQGYLTVFVAAQAMVMLTYSLAGFWKFAEALKQLALRGEIPNAN